MSPSPFAKEKRERGKNINGPTQQKWEKPLTGDICRYKSFSPILQCYIITLTIFYFFLVSKSFGKCAWTRIFPPERIFFSFFVLLPPVLISFVPFVTVVWRKGLSPKKGPTMWDGRKVKEKREGRRVILTREKLCENGAAVTENEKGKKLKPTSSLTCTLFCALLRSHSDYMWPKIVPMIIWLFCSYEFGWFEAPSSQQLFWPPPVYQVVILTQQKSCT